MRVILIYIKASLYIRSVQVDIAYFNILLQKLQNKTILITNKQGHLYFHPIFNERWLYTNIFKVVAQRSVIPGVFSFTNLEFFIIQSRDWIQIPIFMSLIVQDSRNGIYFPITSSRPAFPTSRKTTEEFFRALSESSVKLWLFIFEFHVCTFICTSLCKPIYLFEYFRGVYILPCGDGNGPCSKGEQYINKFKHYFMIL